MRRIEDHPIFKEYKKYSDIGFVFFTPIPMILLAVLCLASYFWGFPRYLGILPLFSLCIGLYFSRKAERLLLEIKPLMSEYEILRYFDPKDW